MKPLVSILIPAYKAEEWISDTINSALAQTWPRKEIIVVDDGSPDRTAEVARRFASKEVLVATKENEGASAARNHAYQLSQGDYIQWLDADDLLAADKVERQLATLDDDRDSRALLSAPWGYFNYRTSRARFVPTSLWQDLSPVEWLLRKLGENLHMQTATWLTSRELTEAAGPWNTQLAVDDDGEYFCRVLLASKGTRFVPGANVYYRASPSNRVSYVGTSKKKKNALLLSMTLHIRYLRSLEDTERVHQACVTYLRTWSEHFYPDQPDIFAQLQNLAIELNSRLEPPTLRRKYAWLKPIVGAKRARWVQTILPEKKAWLLRKWDKAMFDFESRSGERRFS